MKYLIKHKKTIFLFIIYAGIQSVIFRLYHLSLEPIFYSFILFLTVFLLFSIYDTIKYYFRHKELSELKQNIHISLDGLPIPKDLWEKDYQELLERIYQDRKQIISDNDSRFSSLNEYYTMWVHQIKTPISAMRLLLQSETKPASNDELLSELFKIEQYAEMVLQYIRLNSSSTDFLFKKYSLDKIMKESIKKYAKIFISKKISLHYKETNYFVITDEKWLTFVIEQLLSNALKYTNKGSISIYMETKGLLMIKDTGIGIEAEDLPRIFEQGFTGYNGRHYKKSSGIGLFLCKKILDQLSHDILIQSEAGSGTTITLNLSRL